MVFWSLIGAIIGSRVVYVIAHFSEFDSPLEMARDLERAASRCWAASPGRSSSTSSARPARTGYRFFQVADPVALALALGIAIGRIGDLIIGDHLGKPTSWLLAWRYEGGTLAPPFSCVDELCQAALQGGHLQVIDRDREPGCSTRTGAVIATGRGRPPDGPVRHDPRLRSCSRSCGS